MNQLDVGIRGHFYVGADGDVFNLYDFDPAIVFIEVSVLVQSLFSLGYSLLYFDQFVMILREEAGCGGIFQFGGQAVKGRVAFRVGIAEQAQSRIIQWL